MNEKQKKDRKNHHKLDIEIQKQINLQFQYYIKNIIKEHPGASDFEISYLLDMDKSVVNHFILQMEKKGIIRLVKDEEGSVLCYLGRGNSYK